MLTFDCNCIGTVNRVIPKSDTDKFLAASDVHLNVQKSYVYIGYDPHPGAKQSMVGIHAAIYHEGMHVIVSQDTFHSHTPSDQMDAIFAMIRTLKDTYWVFSESIFVLCPEANTISHAKLVEECLYSSGHADLVERVCLMYEVKSDPSRPGLVTTKEVNQCYQIRQLLQENRLRYWTGFFTLNRQLGKTGMRNTFHDQMCNYRYEPVNASANKNVHAQGSKVVTTGKVSGGHDDLLDAAEISALAKILFSSHNKKYAKFQHNNDF